MSVLKAKLNLLRVLKGEHSRYRAIWLLNGTTAIALNDMLTHNPEVEETHIRSIVARRLSFQTQLMRRDLALYSIHSDEVKTILARATLSDNENAAGEVFRFLHHNFKEITLDDAGVILRVAARVYSGSFNYVSLSFGHLQGSKLLATVLENRDLLERIVELHNAGSGRRFPNIDYDKLLEQARTPLVLQEGAL